MNAVRLTGTDSLRRFSQSQINSLRSTEKRRSLSHVTQPMLKLDQGEVSATATASKATTSWLIPAALALLGLSFSTFCTHQLVSDNTSQSTFKAFSPKYIECTDGEKPEKRESSR